MSKTDVAGEPPMKLSLSVTGDSAGKPHGDALNLSLLGATGSIGTQTLDAVRACLPNARVRALTAHSNIEKLALLIDEFTPDMACVPSGDAASALKKLIHTRCEIVTGEEGLLACARLTGANTVVNALTGRAGLLPTLAAIEAGKDVALANKETLVSAGALVMKAAKERGIRLTPIDSEHSAIFQCLQGNARNPAEKLILTASGGPFKNWPKEKIAEATAADALRHPTWSMGAKITIDSATLMNKGLELIEAMWLFDAGAEQIEIVVHPQSVIHSMVQFKDGAVMAQMGLPDMRLPILYALAGPTRIPNGFPRLDFLTCANLTFEAPDTKRFPCLALAIHAARVGGTDRKSVV